MRLLRLVTVVAAVLALATCEKKSPTTPTADPTRIISVAGNLAFGNQDVNTSATRTLTISNSGNSTLTVTGMRAVGGSGTAAFAASPLSGSVPAGGSLSVTVQFTPTVAQFYSTVLTVDGDQTSGNNAINVSGTGVSVASTWTVSGTTREGSSALDGVLVSVLGSARSATSNSQGQYSIPDVTAGTITLRATRSGWNTAEQTVNLQGNTTVDFSLTRTAAPPPQGLTVDSFSSDVGLITNGYSTTLRWSTSNATTVSINNGIGNVSASGTRSISPTSNTTYQITATGSSGSATRSVTVNVRAPESSGIPVCWFSTPSNATAICNNDQTSMSQNRSGTCSQNGGVKCWVCPGALCNP
jgi:hypothetical protein